MRKILAVPSALFIFSFFAVSNLGAQAAPVSDYNELITAINNAETDILITNPDFLLTGSVSILNYTNLDIHASVPANFTGTYSGRIFSMQDSTVNFENISFRNMNNNSFIVADNSTLSFENAAFENNNSGSAESAFVFENGSNVSFTGDTDFISNKGVYGGGFYMAASEATFNDKTLFSGNEAVAGGGFYSMPGFDFINFVPVKGTMTFTGESEFISNKAVSASGGGFYADGTNINFNEKATFIQNETASGGGAAYVTGSDVIFGGFTSFQGNKAEGNGGALYLATNYANNVELSAGSEFIGNEAGGRGGALYLVDSVITLQNASFTNNSAGDSGGAVFLIGDSYNDSYAELNINTVNNGAADNKTVFQGNTANGQSNAIYLDEYSRAIFNTAAGASVEMYDGIRSDTDTAFMTVSGAGNFNMHAGADIYNLEVAAGNFNTYADSVFYNLLLTAGNFNLAGAGGADIVNLTADQNSVLNMQNASHSNVLRVENFNFNGTLKLDGGSGEGSDGDRVIAENADLGANSVLNIKTDAAVDTSKDYRRRYYRVLNYENLTGSFNNVTVNNDLSLASVSLTNEIMYADNWMTVALAGSRLYTDFASIQGLSYNQAQVAKIFDSVSADPSLSLDLDEQISAIDAYADDGLKRAALLDSSGYFLANVIRSAAFGSDKQDIYNRLRYHDVDAHNLNGVWVQARAQTSEIADDDNSRNKYKDLEAGALAGWDIMIEDHSLALGAYGKYDKHDIKQDPKNEATIDELGFGLYGGILKEDWEVKALLSGSFDNFNTTRYISFADRKAEADFSAFTFAIDFEGAIRTYVTETVLLRPFAGIEIKSTSYDSFKEKKAGDLSLKVDSGSFSRSFARIGLGIGSDDAQQFEWYANIEGKYLLTKDTPEITASFISASGTFDSKGAKEGTTIIGFGAGGAYRLSRDFKVFANASYQQSDGYQNIYGNLGVRYMLFGSAK